VSIQTLLDSLATQGIRVRVCEDGSLGVRPRSKLTDELLAILRQHKPGIIAALIRQGQSTGRQAEQQTLWPTPQKSSGCEKCGNLEC
jgi:TubC N-terminal docking domain